MLEGVDLSADLKKKYLEPPKSMGISVSNGIVTVGLEDLSLGRVAISITVSLDDIDGDGGMMILYLPQATFRNAACIF